MDLRQWSEVGSEDVDHYSSWSHDELLHRIRELESWSRFDQWKPSNATAISAHMMSVDTSPSPGSIASTDNESEATTSTLRSKPLKRKDRRPPWFLQIPQTSCRFPDCPLWMALWRIRDRKGWTRSRRSRQSCSTQCWRPGLLKTPLQCNYPRCGRTDRGAQWIDRTWDVLDWQDAFWSRHAVLCLNTDANVWDKLDYKTAREIQRSNRHKRRHIRHPTNANKRDQPTCLPFPTSSEQEKEREETEE